MGLLVIVVSQGTWVDGVLHHVVVVVIVVVVVQHYIPLRTTT